MISLEADLVLAAIRGGFDAKRLPPRYDRCVGELARAGLLDVADAGRDVSSVTGGVTWPVTRDVTLPMTPAERARKARDKRKAEKAARDALRDDSRDSVTAERDASRDASRSLSLSSPLDSGSSSSESPSLEALGDQVVGAREGESVTAPVTPVVTPSVTDRTDLAALDRRDAELARQLRAAYGRRWEREFRDPCPSRASDEDMRSVVRWVAAQPDHEAAIERFIDGAFTAPKWRKPTSRAPWRFIAEDPGATAAFSTKPSASAAQRGPRPSLPRQELPEEPADAGGAF